MSTRMSVPQSSSHQGGHFCLAQNLRRGDYAILSSNNFIFKNPNGDLRLYHEGEERLTFMATRNEHPEKYGWWLDELESSGMSTKRRNELNDLCEISTLTENIKLILSRWYKLYFSYRTDAPIHL